MTGTTITGTGNTGGEVGRELDVLASLAARSDPAATSELLRQVQPMVVRYCRARLGRAGGGTYTTADDVAQEVCLAVLHALPRYRDQGRPFTAFLFRIAANKVTDAHRVAARELGVPVQTVPETAATDAGPEGYAIEADASRRMRDLLDTLPPQHRDVLLLRIAVGLSAEETGQALGMSAGSVRVTQHRALNRLRRTVDPVVRETA
ncbi:RNA polymerase sigma factor ShbA [Cryptosporangium arvum]|uniref:RNA polymerase sigma factor ShbA n=1 Tax=Cryptosporangium arvum TaxID=80871 RepID=UPI0004AD4525|nr:RNA polymerase sigma factor ShbA [Cryptosporangium arvum]